MDKPSIAPFEHAVEKIQPSDRIPTAEHQSLAGTVGGSAGSSSDESQGGTGPVESRAPGHARFTIVRPHAQGGLGQVSLARDERLKRHVALKEIRPDRIGSGSARERFLTEAEITGQLEHPGIVPIYALEEDAQGRPYYAMRFIEGRTLGEAIEEYHRRGTELVFRDLLRRFETVCQTVAYAHRKGVIHRDLKPSNIMLGEYGETLVVDWGLAKRYGDDSAEPASPRDAVLQGSGGRDGSEAGLTQAGQVLGTPGYMAPEQAAGEGVGPAADVFALGAILYELLTGRPPYEAGGAKSVLEQVRDGPPRSPSQVRRGVPKPLDAVCCRAMARAISERYASAAALAEEINRWLADEPVAAYSEPWWVRARRWAKRHRTLVVSGGATLMAAVVLLAVGSVFLNAAWHRESALRGLADERLALAESSKERARRALDEMSSSVIDEWLATQKQLTPEHEQFLQRALQFYEQFATELQHDEKTRVSVGSAYSRVGMIRRRLGLRAEAEAAFRSGVAVLEKLAADYPGNAQYLRDTAGVLSNLAALVQDGGDYAQAESLYAQCIQYQRQALDLKPDDPQARQFLGTHHAGRSSMLTKMDRKQEALAEIDRSLALRSQLVQDFPAVVEYREDLVDTINARGNAFNALGEAGQALAEFAKAFDMLDALSRQFSTVARYRHRLAGVLNNRGIVLDEIGRSAEALAEYQKATPIYEQLVADFPTVPAYLVDLGASYCNMGYLMRDRGDLDAALEWYAKAVRTLQPPLEKDSTLVTVRFYLSNTHWGRATTLQGLERYADAVEDWNRAVELDDRTRLIPRVSRARCLAIVGRHVDAAAAAAELLETTVANAEVQFHSARVYALCAAAAAKEPGERDRADQYGARSVALLRASIAGAAMDPETMLMHDDFKPVRHRADFERLAADIRAEKSQRAK